MDCIFCKIIKGEIPSYKVYEDENSLAFLDISPVSYGHTLIIPKRHYKNIEDIPEDEFCELIRTVKKIGALLKEKLGISGYNLTENNDPIAGQIIQHIHFHIIPRYEGDELQLWEQGELEADEGSEIIKKIRK